MAPTIKSPNVSNLGTFGEIPVSLFTETADISIPLTELKGKDLTLPIVLRYHPASIKPNQRNIKAVSALLQEDESSDSVVVILCITGNTPNFRFQYGINSSTQTINRISIESMGACP